LIEQCAFAIIESLFAGFTLKALTTLSRFTIANDGFCFNLPVIFTLRVRTKVPIAANSLICLTRRF